MKKGILGIALCGVIIGMLPSVSSKAFSYETFIRYDLITGEKMKIMLPKDSYASFPKEEWKEETENEVIASEKVIEILTEKMNETDKKEIEKEKSAVECEQQGILKCIGLENGTGTIVGKLGFGIWKGEGCLLTQAHTVYWEEEECVWKFMQFSMEEMSETGMGDCEQIASAVYIPEAYFSDISESERAEYDYAVVEMSPVQWL